uniref:helix-turn-helix domain-containing protein n=1 Tax=Eubacterium sp. TaxID=142586 RepID=UPI004027FBA0
MQKEDLKNIGIRIVKRRKELHLTQEQIAERMNVSIQMVSNLERGNKAIKIDNLLKLCDILQTSTDYILIGKHTNNDIEQLADKISQLNESDYEMIEMIVNYRLADKTKKV